VTKNQPQRFAPRDPGKSILPRLRKRNKTANQTEQNGGAMNLA